MVTCCMVKLIRISNKDHARKILENRIVTRINITGYNVLAIRLS